MRFLRIAGLLTLISVICLCGTNTVQAGGGPENTVLVVNVDSMASLSIANEYIALRNIPARNVIYLDGITDKQLWDLKNFKAKILGPILDTITKRKLRHVDYIVYSAGFPTTINIKSDQTNFLTTNNVPKENAKIFRPSASINSLTYFARHVMAEEPSYLDLKSNLYMRNRAAMILARPFGGEVAQQYQAAVADFQSEKFQACYDQMELMAEANPQQVALHYWMARAQARLGDINQASLHLLEAIKTGWTYREYTSQDSAFVEHLGNSAFKRVLERIPDYPFDYQPTIGFRGGYVWGPNGMRNTQTEQGQRYLLSTVLAVTRNRGTTEAEAIQNLRQTVAADYSQPEGTFYFTSTKDVRTRTRVMHFPMIMERLQEMGHKAEVVEKKLPSNKDDIIGMAIGSAGYSLKSSKCKIVPGAIVENLTSFGGAMQEGAKQTPLSHPIKFGAAGSSGTVTEPYAILDKFPHPMIYVHYARGASLAEAFDQSVSGPYMLLIVGDALCQPWAEPVAFELSGAPESDDQVSGSLQLNIESEQLDEIARVGIFLDGTLKNASKADTPIVVDTTTLPDGFHELRVVAVKTGLLETQSSQIINFWVNNQQRQSDLSSNKPEYKVSEQIELTFDAAGAQEVAIYHNSRRVAEAASDSGKLTLAAEKLGRGEVQLKAAARINGQWIFSRPVDLKISY